MTELSLVKIDNIPHSIKPNRVEHGKGQEKVANVTATHDATPRSATHLSQVGSNASQDIDHARVSELRQAISDGQLSVNTDRITDRLIDNVRDLLGGMQ